MSKLAFYVGITIFTLFFSQICAEAQPGVKAYVSKALFEKVKKFKYDMVMQELNNIPINDIKEKKITLRDINAHITIPGGPDAIKITFNENQNFIRVLVEQIDIRVDAGWKYKNKLLKFHGSGHVTGKVKYISFNMHFTSQEKDGFQIPKILISDTSVDISKSDWKFKFGGGIKGFILNGVTSIFKGKMVDSIRKAVQKALESKLEPMINKGIIKGYESTAHVYLGVSAWTALADNITVTSTHLVIPIDGTVFDEESGYLRPEPTPVLPKYTSEVESDLILTISRYVFKTIERTFDLYQFQYETIAENIPVTVTFGESDGWLNLNNTKNGLLVKAKGNIYLPAYRSGFDVTLTAEIGYKFELGDDKNMFVFVPEIKKDTLEITTSNHVMMNQILGKSLVYPVFDSLVDYFVKEIELKPVPMKKIVNLPLIASDASSNFDHNYTEARMTLVPA